jgi:plasmid stabilization system protein ParE
VKPYVLADAARNDQFEIWDYLVEHAGLEVADRVITEFHETMCKLAENPLIGHRRDDLTSQSVRFWLVHSYYVIYEPGTEPLAVARILHAARDIPTILES